MIKIKTDTKFLISSPFSRYYNFSVKSDPFLVFPSLKSSQNSEGFGGNVALKRMVDRQNQKRLIPLQSTHMKLIRQSEVYLMEEAVTDTIIKDAAQRVKKQHEELENKEEV